MAVAVVVIALIRRFITTNRLVTAVLMAVALLLPTYDIIITNVLGAYYCSLEPNPKTLIKKKVEYPLSIYWEDNVYTGFNIEDRKLMVMNYLDGKHLTKMALNGDDGKIYVYEAKAGDFKSFKYDPKFENRYVQYASIIMKNEKNYTKVTMPKMNYTVTFNEIALQPFARKFLYSDETKIIDNNTKETIAYNRRYMRFFYNIFPDVALGNLYYYPESICGSNESIDNWLFEYVEETSEGKVKITDKTLNGTYSLTSKNNFLYQKHIYKGE